jgi:hypothetical protein
MNTNIFLEVVLIDEDGLEHNLREGWTPSDAG